MAQNRETSANPASTWIKRLGIAGFLFFFIKGLLWLLVPLMVAYFSFE